MKLYTEEQLKRAIDIADDNVDLLEYKYIISKLTPIELPSDEEIENRANEYHFKLNQRFFTEGAKWVIEQIKQQDDTRR